MNLFARKSITPILTTSVPVVRIILEPAAGSAPNFFKVTGNKLDEYLYTRLTINYNLDLRRPGLNIIDMYKMKTDLKETRFSPYKIPFNYEML